jgi:hypothetical protein
LVQRVTCGPLFRQSGGTSRYLVAMRNLVAIRGIADIDQSAPANLDL